MPEQDVIFAGNVGSIPDITTPTCTDKVTAAIWRDDLFLLVVTIINAKQNNVWMWIRELTNQ